MAWNWSPVPQLLECVVVWVDKLGVATRGTPLARVHERMVKQS